MVAPADPLDDRIDLDGIDALGAPHQRAADVVAGAGADDQHVAEGVAAGVAVQQVRQRIRGKARVQRLHLLVADQVDANQPLVRPITDAVIRRPHLGIADKGRRHCEPDHQRACGGEAAGPRQGHRQEKVRQTGQHEGKPPCRRQLHERACGKQDDARDAAENVDGVRLETVWQLRERTAKLLSGPNHRQRDDEKEIAAQQFDRHDEARHVAGLILDAEEHHLR